MTARDGYRVAVVGATGQVGTVMLRLLRERAFPTREIVPFASERSAGRELDGGLVVQPLSDETIQGFDLAIFSAGGSMPCSTAWVWVSSSSTALTPVPDTAW